LAVAQGDTREKTERASSTFHIADAAALAADADSPTNSQVSDMDASAHSAMDLEKEGLFLRHVRALFRKRAANFKRDKRAWFCTTILPSLFVLIGFLIATYVTMRPDLDPLPLTLEDYNTDGGLSPRNPITFNSPGSYTCQPAVECTYHEPIMDSTTNIGSDELYYFCGFQARLGPNATCSVSESEIIMNQINEAGADPQGYEVRNLKEVSNLMDRRLVSLGTAVLTHHLFC